MRSVVMASSRDVMTSIEVDTEVITTRMQKLASFRYFYELSKAVSSGLHGAAAR
jgi:hypothetical protein